MENGSDAGLLLRQEQAGMPLERRETGWNRMIHGRRSRLAVAAVLSLLTGYLAVRTIRPSEVIPVLAQADPLWVGAALASVGLNTLARAARWRALFGEQARSVPLRAALKSLLSGQMLNTLYPGRFGELNRAYTIGGLGFGSPFVLGTIVIEKAIDLVSYGLVFMLLVGLLSLGEVDLPGALQTPAQAAVAGAVFLVGLAAILLAFPKQERGLRLLERHARWLPERFVHLLIRWFRGGLEGLAASRRQDLLKLALWSAVVWGTAALNNLLALQAIGLLLPWSAALLVLIVLQAGISVPSLPGKIGVFEYACILALTPYGVPPAQALGYGILLHGIVLLPTTLLGVVFFTKQGLE